MSTNRKSRLKRCLSCRQLKIGCDRGRPCEYCVHTSRECIYENDSPSPPEEGEQQQQQQQLQQKVTQMNGDDNSLMQSQAPSTITGGEQQEIVSDLDQDHEQLIFEEIPRESALNNATSILSLSRFELYLTNFFNERGQFIFNFNNRTFMKVWFYELPLSFAYSPLVRESHYAFSSLMLMHCLNPKVVQDISAATGISSSLLATNNFISPTQRQQLRVMSLQYFDQSVKQMQQLVSNATLIDGSYNLETANQLFFGLIFQFTYLAYDHLSVPLLSFDTKEVDYITLCKSYKIATGKCIKPILNSPLKELFLYRMVKSTVPPEDQVTSPIILSLLDDLEKLQYVYADNPGLSKHHEIYRVAINEMKQGIFSTAMCKFPFPFMLCCLDFSSELRDLMHEGQYFALRFLFVYSCLCVFCKFYMERNANLWTDYIVWFKDRSTFLDGGFTKELDSSLYNLVTQTDFIIKYKDFESFDPRVEWHKFEAGR